MHQSAPSTWDRRQSHKPMPSLYHRWRRFARGHVTKGELEKSARQSLISFGCEFGDAPRLRAGTFESDSRTAERRSGRVLVLASELGCGDTGQHRLCRNWAMHDTSGENERQEKDMDDPPTERKTNEQYAQALMAERNSAPPSTGPDPKTSRSGLWARLANLERGNWAQWVAAMASLAMVGIAGYGIIRAVPILENEMLRNEQRALRQAVADERIKTWQYVCDQFVKKASGASLVTPFDAAELTPKESDVFGQHDRRLDALIVLNAMSGRAPSTGADLLRSELSRGDLPLLSADKRQQFEELIASFISQHQKELDAPLVPGPARDSEAPKARFQRADQAWKQYDLALDELLNRCRLAAQD